MPGGLTPDFTTQVYAPTQVHHGQVLNVFLPDRPMPPGGYPCILFVYNSGFNTTGLHQTITDEQGHLYLLLRLGFAIASMMTTIANNATTQGGATIIPGRGVVLPVTDSSSKNIASAWVTNAFLEKDVPLAVQYLRRNASRFGLSGFIITDGRSGGAQGAISAALWPDMNGVSGFWSGASSRPDGCIVRALAACYWTAISTGSVTDIATAPHFYHDSSTTNLLTSADTTLATALADALGGTKTGCSPLRIGFDPAMTWHDSVATARQALIRQTNANCKFCIYTGEEELGSNTIDNASETGYTATGYPSLAVGPAHDPWNAYALREALAELGCEFSATAPHSRLMTNAVMQTYATANATAGSGTLTASIASEVVVEDGEGDATSDVEIAIAEWAQALWTAQAPMPVSAAATSRLLDEVVGR